MTAIYYPDLVATSSRGVFRFEATSPNNLPDGHPDKNVSGADGPWPGAFQKDFTFALWSDGSSEPVWTRPQGEVAPVSPAAVHVSDEGWCVVRTHGPFSASLVVLSPSGQRVLSVDVLAEVFVGEARDEVSGSSAGPFWAERSLAYFLELSGRAHFCVRTRLGRRIVIDLVQARLVPSSSAYHPEILQAEEERWTMVVLEEASGVCDGWGRDEDSTIVKTTTSAVVHAGRLGLDAAVPHLRRLESTVLEGGYGFLDSSIGTDLHPDQGDGFWAVVRYAMRSLVQRALRRLDQIPAGWAPCYLRQLRPGSDEPLVLPVPECLVDRDERVRALTPGSMAKQVLARAGMPDELMRRGWDYHVGDRRGHTVRLRWDRSTGQVASIEHLTPPTWVNHRDR